MAVSFYVRLVRHGETDANVRRVVESHTPTPLNEVGRRQADALGAAWRAEGVSFHRVLSSDTTRAMETCQRALAAAGRPAAQPQPEPMLRERDVGQMAGLTYDEARRRWGDSQEADHCPAGSELPAAARLRAGRFFDRLVDELAAEGCDGAEVAVFSHAGLLHFLLQQLQQQHRLQLSAALLPAGELHFCHNTGQTRLHGRRGSDGELAISCEFLHRDDHLTGDLAPTVYLMPSLGKIPRDSVGVDKPFEECMAGDA
ncbi:2,3-bisphosphoglycerate-dependent phosphoglycerate mutase-like [Amphibalanus amphitrite]|uniref:2,3-bisphosphoglycerate-dependent phosphoglycerate mutase-like n=1 Tax=Amphibalanus amphitrite TaxID=1232801 RepID=UPI001C920FE9|nr:2,3-bisphosphoglycerate-dependent phosphoglycerate mutase-like [Amphibalanus amphitrite]